MDRLPSLRRRRVCLAGLAAAVVAGGCSRQADPIPRAAAALPPVAAPSGVPATPTTSQAERWGAEFATAIVARDPAAANALIDWDAIFDTATGGLGVAEPVRVQFIARGRESAATTGLAAQLVRAVLSGGDVSFVRGRSAGVECRAVLRVIQETGLNYYDARLVVRDGRVLARDIDIARAGEPVSATIRRYFLMFAAAQSSVPPAASDGELFHHARELQSLFAAADAADHTQVLEIVAGLPPSLREDEAILQVRAIAAAQAGPEEHSAAIDALRAACPNAPGLALACIDLHARRGEQEECLAAIDRLDAQIGGDPYLDAVRATACFVARDYPQATRLIEQAINAMPDLLQLYWIRVAIALAERDHDETAAWLDRITTKFGVACTDLEQVPDYAEFVKSPEYRDWQARRGGSPVPATSNTPR
jgi:hypothetical protein